MFNSGIRGRRARDGEGVTGAADNFVQQQFTVPYVSRFAVTDGSYVDLDDTAVDTAGGQTIVLYGSGFRSGATVVVGGTTIAVVTVLDSNRITFTSPALAAGSYNVYVINSNGGTGVLLPGLVYSGLPSFSTAAGNIGSYVETQTISNTVVATEGADPITYTLVSGTLPPGATLYANGVISGTSELTSNSTTYTFTIKATDSELQDSTRQFSITINPDQVTWATPTEGQNYDLVNDTVSSNVTLSASSLSGYSVSYTANTLPTGLSLTGNTVSGTPTSYSTNTTVSTLLTATAATTNRSATRTITWTISVADQFFNLTALLLQSDSTTFITDASTNNFLITRNGDTRPSRLSPYWPGGWSGYFDGTGDYLSLPTNSALDFGTGNFTIECWFYLTGNSAQNGSTNRFAQILGRYTTANNTGYELNIAGNSTITGTGFEFINTVAGTQYKISANTTISQQQWNHLAIVRNSTTTSIYFNGSLIGSGTLGNQSITSTNDLWIGALNVTSFNHFINGYISNLRLIKGTALYTANFTPSTSSLTTVANTSLLTLRDAILADDSPYNFTITRTGDTRLTTFSPFNTTPHTVTPNGYSVYFDGTDDNLSMAHNSEQDLGAVDFTVECWFCQTAAYNNFSTGAILTKADTGATREYNFLVTSTAMSIEFFGTSTIQTSATYTPGFSIGVWYHIAYVRQGQYLYYYVNGTQIGSTNLGAGYTFAAVNIPMRVGRTSNSTYNFNFNGYISNLRVVKGTAVYTSNFTPPITSLTAISGTMLLTCQSTTFVDNSTNAFAITANGNSQPTTFNPFGETITTISDYSYDSSLYSASAYFDGTGDYLQANIGAPTSTTIFTFECWIYPLSWPGTDGNHIINLQNNNIFLATNNNSGQGRFVLRNDNASSVVDLIGGTIPLNQWSHLAGIRNGSVTSLFINGIRVATNSSTGTLTATGANVEIGRNYGTASRHINGYLSNVRIVYGTAVYDPSLTTLSVPTAPLTAVANTSLLTLQSDIGSNSAQFVDQSPNNHLITRNGNASQGSYSPLNPTAWSAYFDGSGDRIAITSSVLVRSAFTVETWCYLLSNTTATLFDFVAAADTYGMLAQHSSGNLNVQFFSTSAVGSLIGTITYSFNSNNLYNTWVHVAVTFNGSVYRLFINGNVVGSINSSTQIVAITRWAIGVRGNNTIFDPWLGYLSNFRIVSGTALYTANFTPSTTTLSSINNTNLLIFDGPTLTDDSPYNHTLSRDGDVRITPFGPFASHTVTPNGYSVYFDGTGDYLITPSISSITGNFTIEGWFYLLVPNNTWYPYLFGSNSPWTAAGGIGISYSTQTTVTDSTNLLIQVSSTSITLSTFGNIKERWNHIAIVRSGTTVTGYLNGNSVGTMTKSGTINTTTFYIGGTDEGGSYDNHASKGYISNFRIVNGTAIYTANFTPSTTSLTAVANTSLLTCHTSSILDSSSNNYTITVTGDARPRALNPFGETKTVGVSYSPVLHGGSAYFDGSGDYLAVPSNPGFSLGGGSFTIECWVYISGAQTQSFGHSIVGTYPGSGNGWNLAINRSQSPGPYGIQWVNGSAAAIVFTYGTYIPNNTWVHIAIVRTSTATNGIRAYINGALVATGTDSTNDLVLQTLYIGAQGTASCFFPGYISNLRILKGTALYTSAFVPPAAPGLPTTANTSLLLNFTSSSIYDGTGRSVIESLADVRVANDIKKYGSGSLYFDGTGDYVVIPHSPVLHILQGDFTIEFWVYLTAASGFRAIVAQWSNAPSNLAGYIVGVNNSNFVFYFAPVSGSVFLTGSTTITTGTWYHVAVTRSGSTFTVFQNGTSIATGSNAATGTPIATNTTLGNYYDSSGVLAATTAFAGYIDDLRITRGRARYTSNFTPPAQLLNK